MKKKIIIYDVAAESGGALTVLDSFYEQFCNEDNYESFFVLSKVSYPEKNNVHIIRLPWVKKSWLHRLYCDYIYMPFLISKFGIYEVLSLQNIGIPMRNLKQTIYVHNAIPFTEHRFLLFREPYLWTYKNIIGRMIYRSIRCSNRIIVQTEWMKKEIEKRKLIESEAIYVQKVIFPFEGNKQNEISKIPIFFFPGTPLVFKNHAVIVRACRELIHDGIRDFTIVFTFEANDNRISRKIAKTIARNKLPIQLLGKLDKNKMNEYYRKSILIFPSYLETVGLPLLEAQEFNMKILAANCLYAKESVGSYSRCDFFEFDNYKELSLKMKRLIMKWNVYEF